MKPQDAPLSPSELRESFDKARTGARADLSKNGSGVILQQLSQTVRDLQEAGADISISVFPGSDSNALLLMTSARPIRYSASISRIDAYGYIAWGKVSRMFAIASQHDGDRVSRLYLSEGNVAPGQDGRSPIPGMYFDFGEDATAMQKMQMTLATICARTEAILENDPGNVFNKEPAAANIMAKPKGQLKL